MDQQNYKTSITKKITKKNKYIENRKATPEEILYIFQKVLDGWKTIKIYNLIIQNNPKTKITKKIVENIASGNVKIHNYELSEENFNLYLSLREQVYELLRNKVSSTKV
jgi:hypothetical protein